jgi:hypothetical protein
MSALAMVDAALYQIGERQNVRAAEVTDWLLDIRLAVADDYIELLYEIHRRDNA